MASKCTTKKRNSISFTEYVLNQKSLSFATLLGSKRFKSIAEHSKLAGKENKPFLNQDVFTTMREGTEIIDTVFLDVFQWVGDCDEKPRW